jgi:excisionase family DNA binding protein
MDTSSLVYTPEQTAELLQLSKATVYKLIEKGEIIAKKFGNVYRIPKSSLSFIFSGLDYDLYLQEQLDRQELSDADVESTIRSVRQGL